MLLLRISKNFSPFGVLLIGNNFLVVHYLIFWQLLIGKRTPFPENSLHALYFGGSGLRLVSKFVNSYPKRMK